MSQTLNLFTFQDNAIISGDGNEYTIYDANAITLEITGNSISRTIIFEGFCISGAWYPIKCINLSTLTMDSQTTGNNELWQADVSGLIKFRARISSVSGGNVIIKGKVI